MIDFSTKDITTTDKYEYYRICLKNGLYKDAYFIKSCLALFTSDSTEEYLIRKDNNGYYYLNEGNKIYFTNGKDINSPLLNFKEEIKIPDGELPNYKGELITTVGRLLQNYLMTIGPFGSKVPYINKRFFPKDIYPQILYKWNRSLTEVNDKNPAKEDEIFTENFLEFAENVLSLTNYTQIVIPSITEKALCSNPLLEKRAKELLEQYKDQLGDPTIISKIDEELVQIDKDWLKDDDSNGFLISNKDYANVRKRLFYHFGVTFGLDGKPKYINKPLSKGLDINNIPEYVNDAYAGSIGRGLETAEGGVEVKNALRSAANLKVTIDDCGSKKGKVIKIPDTKEKALKYINYSYIDNGTTKKITESNIESLLGKYLIMRAPSYCLAHPNAFCKTCVGPNVASYPNGITSINASPGSKIMLVRMKGMHVSMLNTKRMKISNYLS